MECLNGKNFEKFSGEFETLPRNPKEKKEEEKRNFNFEQEDQFKRSMAKFEEDEKSKEEALRIIREKIERWGRESLKDVSLDSDQRKMVEIKNHSSFLTPEKLAELEKIINEKLLSEALEAKEKILIDVYDSPYDAHPKWKIKSQIIFSKILHF